MMLTERCHGDEQYGVELLVGSIKFSYDVAGDNSLYMMAGALAWTRPHFPSPIGGADCLDCSEATERHLQAHLKTFAILQ